MWWKEVRAAPTSLRRSPTLSGSSRACSWARGVRACGTFLEAVFENVMFYSFFGKKLAQRTSGAMIARSGRRSAAWRARCVPRAPRRPLLQPDHPCGAGLWLKAVRAAPSGTAEVLRKLFALCLGAVSVGSIVLGARHWDVVERGAGSTHQPQAVAYFGIFAGLLLGAGRMG